MSKAVSWTGGKGEQGAREAARETARRQGKSLGEWLHGVIADDPGTTVDPVNASGDRQRIEAVTACLERMRGDANLARRPLAETLIGKSSDGALPGGVSRRSPADEIPSQLGPEAFRRAEARFEQAIDAMQRTAQRSDRRAEDMLTSVASLLEAGERRRERERAGVATLAEKLADIEERLSDRHESPIKQSLARLEDRLEQIGRRGRAEADAGRSPATTSDDVLPPPQMRRLEDKLNAVLAAIGAGRPAPAMATSALAFAAARSDDEPQPELRLSRRRLGEAIADITERQRLLDAGTSVNGRRTTGAGAPSADTMRETPIASSRSRRDGNVDFEALRRDINAMAERLHELAPRQIVSAIETKISQIESRLGHAHQDTELQAMDGLREDVHAIGHRVDAMARALTPIEATNRLQTQIEEIQGLVARRTEKAVPDRSALEALLADLGHKIEAVQAPEAGHAALDALQSQVAALASRLESTETNFQSLATIDRSMRELFAHLEETRSFAEAAASRAARDAVKTAVAEKGFDRPAPRADIAVLKAMQEDAELRTHATLDVVHATLAKVVDRLAALEQGLAEPRDSRPAADRQTEPLAQGRLALGATEPMVEPRRVARRPVVERAASGPQAAEAGSGAPDFIAAARRAAQAAQNDPVVVAIRDGGVAPRAGLAAKSRDYVASQKRPVLLALAAILAIAATIALVQRLPLKSAGEQTARGEMADPIRLAGAVASRPAMPAAARIDALAPKALPRVTPALAAQIPGSDPIATGSIPSLPAFAARAGMPQQTQPAAPSLPAGLVRMAEAGDGAAAFTLATAYAEGRDAPRDLQRAAKLYTLAANKGIVPAQYRLGALYERGLGVPQDKTRAKSLYREAAEAGNPRAMHNLAVLLADGDGQPDYEGAATWFRKAAQYGVHDSQFNLAILLTRGMGVEQSLVQAYQWFAIAAAQGDSDAAGKRDEVGGRLNPSELSVAKALAAAFHARSPDPAAVQVSAPSGGWDGDSAPLHLNSAKSKIS